MQSLSLRANINYCLNLLGNDRVQRNKATKRVEAQAVFMTWKFLVIDFLSGQKWLLKLFLGATTDIEAN